MTSPSDELLTRHDALIRTDNAFQRRARLLQSLWREEQGLPIGEHDGRPLGSRLVTSAVDKDLANYLTETIRAVVRREVLDPERSQGKLYSKPRIFNDLLSSQPLCFNLFGELQQDLALASRVFHRLEPGRIQSVTAIHFEHSPSRGDAKYTGDKSAFDVFVEYVNAAGAKGFAAIEVKYHENLANQAAPDKPRYEEVAIAMGCFKPDAFPRLKAKPLQQIWRDHLLEGSLLLDRDQGYEDAFFAFLYPKDNEPCADAVEAYRTCLLSETSFVPWTLEVVVDAIKAEGGAPWIHALERRYLGFDKIDSAT